MNRPARRTEDEQRINRAFELNSLDLLHFFERRVDQREDAADLLSETMLVAWRKVHVVPRDPVEARMWLFATARYIMLNYRRGQHKQHELAEALRDELIRAHPTPASIPGPGEHAVNLLAVLSDPFAEMLRLVHWDGFSVDQASRLLGLSRSTGRRRYDRAKAQLRNSIEATQNRHADQANEVRRKNCEKIPASVDEARRIEPPIGLHR